MKSLIGLPNTHLAGDSFVAGSCVFRYWSMAHCKALLLRLPCGSVLLVMSRLTVLMPISAVQLFLIVGATDDRHWWTDPNP